MIKWKRPSGSIIETNDSDASIEYAVANGWEQVDKPKPKPAKKATKKVVKDDDSVAGDRRGSGEDRS
jgi:hypothetical protein